MGLYSGVRMFLAVVANEAILPDLREEMLRAARASGNPWAIALAIQNMARAASLSGDFEAAYAGFAEAATLYRNSSEIGLSTMGAEVRPATFCACMDGMPRRRRFMPKRCPCGRR